MTVRRWLALPPGCTHNTRTASDPLSDEPLAHFQFMTPCARWKTRATNHRRQQVWFATFFFFGLNIIKRLTPISPLSLVYPPLFSIMQRQQMCQSKQQLILTGRRSLLPRMSVSTSQSGGSSQQRRVRAARIQVLQESPENAPLQHRDHVFSVSLSLSFLMWHWQQPRTEVSCGQTKLTSHPTSVTPPPQPSWPSLRICPLFPSKLTKVWLLSPLLLALV